VHHSDDETWKHFNIVHPYFSSESRNVRLGLYTYGFNPFGSFAVSCHNLFFSYSPNSPFLFQYIYIPKQCRFEVALFLFLFLLDIQQGKRCFLFSSLCFFLSLPRALLEPKPDATRLMMRR